MATAEGEALIYAASALGGRWILPLLYELSKQPLRFSELKRRLPMIPGKSLVRVLDKLETGGLVKRQVLSTRPPRVTYALIQNDPLLRDLLKAAIRWGKKNAPPAGSVE